MSKVGITALTAMAHVADVQRSIAFYAHLGFEVRGSFAPPGEDQPSWVSLVASDAQLMLTRADAPVIADQQGVLFYLYCADVAGMRRHLVDAGFDAGEITKPFFNPHGDFRFVDPDGYVIFVTHT